MDFLEKNLEDIIYEDFDVCVSNGLNIKGVISRQVDLFSYGRTDLICTDVNHNNIVTITILELKKSKIGYNEIGQLSRYITGMWQILGPFRKSVAGIDFRIKGVIVGKEIEKNGDFVFMHNNLKNITTYTYKYTAAGIIFNENDGKFIRINDCGIKKTNPKLLDIKKHILLCKHKNHMDSYNKYRNYKHIF